MRDASRFGGTHQTYRQNGGHNLGALCETVSMEWVDAPPAGAEDWTDDEWEAAIEQEARRRLGREIVARMDAQRAETRRRENETRRQQRKEATT